MRIGIGFLVLISIFILSFFGIGQALYKDDNTINIYAKTDQLTESLKNITAFTPINLTNITNQSDRNAYRVVNTVSHLGNFLVGVTTELAGFGIEYGFNHPYWDAMKVIQTIIRLFILYLIIIAIIPIIVICYLIYSCVKYMRNKIKNRTGKK